MTRPHVIPDALSLATCAEQLAESLVALRDGATLEEIDALKASSTRLWDAIRIAHGHAHERHIEREAAKAAREGQP